MFYRSRDFSLILPPRTARVYCVSNRNIRLVVGGAKCCVTLLFHTLPILQRQVQEWSIVTGITLKIFSSSNRTAAIAMKQEWLQCKSERLYSCILHLQLLSKPNHTASHRRCCYCDKFPALLQSISQYISFVTAVFRTDWSRFVRPVHTIQCSCTICVGRVPEDFA
jgi:hypothetical protein